MLIQIGASTRGDRIQTFWMLGLSGIMLVIIWLEAEYLYLWALIASVSLALIVHFRNSFNRDASRKLSQSNPARRKEILTQIMRKGTHQPFMDWRDLAARISANSPDTTILIHHPYGNRDTSIDPIPHLFEPVPLKAARTLNNVFRIKSQSKRRNRKAVSTWQWVALLALLLVASLMPRQTLLKILIAAFTVLLSVAFIVILVMVSEWIVHKARERGGWLIAPSTLLCTNFRGTRQIMRRSKCLFLAVESDFGRWRVTVASAGNSRSLSVNHRQLEILLSAWLSPIEPPLEHDDDLNRAPTPS